MSPSSVTRDVAARQYLPFAFYILIWVYIHTVRKHHSAYTWKRNVYVQKMQSLWVSFLSIPLPPTRLCFKSHRSWLDSTTTANILHINVTQADIALAPAYRLSYTTRADDNTFALEEVYLWELELWFLGIECRWILKQQIGAAPPYYTHMQRNVVVL